MAIFTNVYGDGHTPDYEGCVLDWYEHNGYDDSDWYAICWNEEKQTIDKVLFDTTRCACSSTRGVNSSSSCRMPLQNCRPFARKKPVRYRCRPTSTRRPPVCRHFKRYSLPV